MKFLLKDSNVDEIENPEMTVEQYLEFFNNQRTWIPRIPVNKWALKEVLEEFFSNKLENLTREILLDLEETKNDPTYIYPPW